MWKGYEYALCQYAYELAVEMERRQKWKPDVAPRWKKFFKEKMKEFENTGMPPWFGNPEFHDSHKSNLLRKNPEWYGQFGWNEEPSDKYVWPI